MKQNYWTATVESVQHLQNLLTVFWGQTSTWKVVHVNYVVTIPSSPFSDNIHIEKLQTLIKANIGKKR
jgi:hypothetical protein